MTSLPLKPDAELLPSQGLSPELSPAAREAIAGAKLIVATHNRGKLVEMRELLAEHVPGLGPQEVISAAAVGLPEPVEDGLTFQDNATIKARTLAEATGVLTMADDSGLCVDVLGGAPGIFSARWSGQHGNDQANYKLLLAQLDDIAPEHRRARFTCAAVLAVPGGEELVVERHMEGWLLTEPRGEGGFGYDPIFLPESEAQGQGRSAAQLSSAEKNAMSHRGQVMRAIAPLIAERLRSLTKD